MFGYLRLNKKWILPIFCFPSLWRAFFGFTGLERKLFSGFLADKTILASLLFPIFVSQVLFSFGLGLSFKRKGSESWLFRLPVRDFTFSFTPYTLIAIFGIFVFFLAPYAWNYLTELSGFPVCYILGILPVSTYLGVRSIKSSPYGLVFGILVGFLILGFGEFLVQFFNGRYGLIDGFLGLFEFFNRCTQELP